MATKKSTTTGETRKRAAQQKPARGAKPKQKGEPPAEPARRSEISDEELEGERERANEDEE